MALILRPHERPKSKAKHFALSLQHLFAMFGATILVPILTGLDISVALFTSGVGTLIYIICTKAKVPVYLGSSFAYISVIISISGYSAESSGVYGAVMTGLFVVGVIYVLIATAIRFWGIGWINKILPPLVIGPAVIAIGLGLAVNSINDLHLTESQDFFANGNWKYFLTGAIAFTLVVVVALKGKGFIKIIPFIIALVGGFIASIILGIANLDGLVNVVQNPSDWFSIPSFSFLGFGNGQYQFLGSTFTFHQVSLAGIISIAPIALVTVCEHIGDHAVLSKVCDEDYLNDPGLKNTLLGSGIGTCFAAMVGGPPNTTYGENTSVVSMTRVGSVWVTGLAAVLAICLSFCNILVVFLQAIPSAVMGGMSVVLYGFIAANGLRVLIDSKVDFYDLKTTIIIFSMLVVGVGGAYLNFSDDLKFMPSTVALLLGIVLNLVLRSDKKKAEEENSLS